MGIFDVFKRHKDDAGGTGAALKDRATGMMSGHADKVNQGFDKAGQMADDKTGNKYTDQINTGVGKAKDMYGQETGQPATAPDPAAGTPNPDPDAQGGDPSQPPQG
jgi:antitoxin protein of toxin-antitoxin system